MQKELLLVIKIVIVVIPILYVGCCLQFRREVECHNVMNFSTDGYVDNVFLNDAKIQSLHQILKLPSNQSYET